MSHLSFFRQVGWVLFATMAAGACNTLVHVFARNMPEGEYGLFSVFLQSALPALAIPAIAIQTSFAQITAGAVTESQRRDLKASARNVIFALLALWAVGAVLVALFHDPLLRIYKIGSPWALVVLMSVALMVLLHPVFAGILQGRQDFLWWGWVTMLASAGRVVGVGLLVTLLGGTALSAMLGVLVGVVAALAVAVWRTRDLWAMPTGDFGWTRFLRQVGPLSVALGAMTLLTSLDASAVRMNFEEQVSGLYGAAGAVGRALIYLAAAITTVMFPRVVREAALSEKSQVLAMALGATFAVGATAALFCTFLPELPLRLIQGAKYVEAAPLVPWFAWCLLPLALAGTLVNNLLARGRFGVALPMLLIAVAYWLALPRFSETPRQIIATMGVAALTALAVSAVMTWWDGRTRSKPPAAGS